MSWDHVINYCNIDIATSLQRDSPCNGVKVIQFLPGAAFSERYLGLPAKEEHAYSVRLKSSERNYS